MNLQLRLCVIDPIQMRLRVYKRNVHGKVWVIAEYVIEDWDIMQINKDIEIVRVGGKLWPVEPGGAA